MSAGTSVARETVQRPTTPLDLLVDTNVARVGIEESRETLAALGFPALVAAIERADPPLSDEAEIRLYQRWIERQPEAGRHCFGAWFNLGVALARAGDQARAAIAYTTARTLKPDFHPAAVNLGLILEAAGDTDAALHTWDAALQGVTARTALLNQRARLLEGLGRLDEAETTLRASLQADPTQPDALQHWLHIRQKTCVWPVLDGAAFGLAPAALLRGSGPLGILALTDDVGLQREVAAAFIARKMPPAPTRLSVAGGYRHARLRIGYLSSDFCRHAMSFLVAELFERHDRARFEVFGYCATLEDGSDIRRRVLAAFDHVRFVRECGDEAVARRIRDDEIDVLIDLNGLTARTRLAVLRWRPAPIQATYLGFVGPVPLPELDFLLCDDVVVPPRRRPAYRPQPLAVAPVYQANDSKRAIAAPIARADVGLPEDRFVFCCFSNHYKITEAMFDAWLAILRAVEGSVLWLSADNVWSQANLRCAAARGGIAPERIMFADRTAPEIYMRRLALADLFLDTFPYNAGTVASDAIRMQVPLLTLCGDAFASRMAASLLMAIGAADGVATDLAIYTATAIRLATDPIAYAAFRQPFAGDAWARAVGDIAGFTAHFEATLLQAAAQLRTDAA